MNKSWHGGPDPAVTDRARQLYDLYGAAPTDGKTPWPQLPDQERAHWVRRAAGHPAIRPAGE